MASSPALDRGHSPTIRWDCGFRVQIYSSRVKSDFKAEKPGPRKLHDEPFGSNSLVKCLGDEDLAGSLVARPRSAEGARDEVEILAVGPDVKDVQIDDDCLLRRFFGLSTECDGVDYVIVSAENLLIILTPAKGKESIETGYRKPVMLRSCAGADGVSQHQSKNLASAAF